MKSFLMTAAMVAATLAALPAGATVLTFEGHQNTSFSAPITLDAYTLGNVAGDEQHFHLLHSDFFAADEVPNGTGILFNDRNTRLFIQLTDGGLFTLGSFDASALRFGANGSGGATMLRISAYVDDALKNSVDVAINNAAYTTSNGAALGAFDRLVVDGLNGGGGFALDNVTVSAVVPEPAGWAVMIAGFGLTGASLRRRRTAAA